MLKICHIHKKNNKQINNSKPVALLPIHGKLFKRLILNFLFNYPDDLKRV